MRQLFTALCIALAAALILGGMDSRDALVIASHERAAAQKKADVKPADKVWLQLPLECQQYIAMRSAGEKWVRKPVCSADLTKRGPK